MAIRRRKSAQKVVNGHATVNTTYNNVIITIANVKGDTIAWESSGSLGFKGPRRSTPHAAQLVADKVAKDAIDVYGLKTLDVVNVSGPGAGRDSALRALKSAGLEIKKLVDTTGIPHNGCRRRKKRRV